MLLSKATLDVSGGRGVFFDNVINISTVQYISQGLLIKSLERNISIKYKEYAVGVTRFLQEVRDRLKFGNHSS